MPTQSIPLAHPWDAGVLQHQVVSAVPSGLVRWAWPGVGEYDLYTGRQVWGCFRGLALPQGATVTAATLAGWSMAGSGRWRVQLTADADPPGGVAAVEAVLAELGATEVQREGLSEAQAAAVVQFWESTIYAETEPPAQVLAYLEYVYAQYLEENYIAGVQDMVTAFGPWETAWPFNWAGWTPARGLDLQSPEEGSALPALTTLLQALADDAAWQPGGAVLLVGSVLAADEADPDAVVTVEETTTPVLTVEWEESA